jgi:hypothetical protein
MPTFEVACPYCGSVLRAPPLTPGTLVKCPRCGREFPLPSEEESSRRPLRKGANEAIAEPQPDTGLPLPPPPSPLRRGSELRPHELLDWSLAPDEWDRRSLPQEPISVDLSRWMKYADAYWGRLLGPSIVYILAAGLLQMMIGFVPFLGPLFLISVGPPLWAGLTGASLSLLKSQRCDVSDFFSGFECWASFVGLFLLSIMIGIACAVPAVAFLALAVAACAGGNPGFGLSVFLVGLTLYVPITLYIQIRFFFFAAPLILDRHLGPVQAIEASWRLSKGCGGALFGVVLVLALINLAGAAFCLVGLFFTIPFTSLVCAAGYLLVAGTRPPVLPEKPPRRWEGI